MYPSFIEVPLLRIISVKRFFQITDQIALPDICLSALCCLGYRPYYRDNEHWKLMRKVPDSSSYLDTFSLSIKNYCMYNLSSNTHDCVKIKKG